MKFQSTFYQNFILQMILIYENWFTLIGNQKKTRIVWQKNDKEELYLILKHALIYGEKNLSEA